MRLRSLSNLELGRAPPLDMPLLATPPDQRLTPGLLSGHKAHLSKSPAAFAFLASVRSRLDAPRCQNQPSIPGRPEARRPASLVTTGLPRGSKQDTLACPPHPARNSSTSLKSLSLQARGTSSRSPLARPALAAPARARERANHHVSATLCLIIDNKSLSFCKATSYPTPFQALP